MGLFKRNETSPGMETQRQWAVAIGRTTPILLVLFSLVTLLANHLQAIFLEKSTNCSKSLPTFSDALLYLILWAATLRQRHSILWCKVPLRALFERLWGYGCLCNLNEIESSLGRVHPVILTAIAHLSSSPLDLLLNELYLKCVNSF